jgi:hypothetical protein
MWTTKTRNCLTETPPHTTPHIIEGHITLYINSCSSIYWQIDSIYNNSRIYSNQFIKHNSSNVTCGTIVQCFIIFTNANNNNNINNNYYYNNNSCFHDPLPYEYLQKLIGKKSISLKLSGYPCKFCSAEIQGNYIM